MRGEKERRIGAPQRVPSVPREASSSPLRGWPGRPSDPLCSQAGLSHGHPQTPPGPSVPPSRERSKAPKRALAHPYPSSNATLVLCIVYSVLGLARTNLSYGREALWGNPGGSGAALHCWNVEVLRSDACTVVPTFTVGHMADLGVGVWPLKPGQARTHKLARRGAHPFARIC